ncbi:MAG: hypothetical protein IJK32_02900, partial [Bacteroidales bacterium]|nr:hypothetical protein [Bacteroidales bacterium]
MKRWRVISLMLLSLLFSCEPEKESEGFLAPEIVSAEAKVNGSSVSLECALSSPRAETCGFVFWAEGDEKKTVISELSTTSFSSTIAGLIPGKEYEWYAFARAGGSEIRSQTGIFTVPKPVTPVPGPVAEPVGINIPDPYFKRYVLENFDVDGDGALSEEEGLKITSIEVSTDLISSVSGIEYFKNLTYLSCSGAPEGSYRDGSHPGLLEAIDVRSNTKLRSLKCDGNMIRELKLGDNPMLEEIYCNNNLIKSIDFSGAPKLGSINVAFNELTELDLSKNTRLWNLNFIENNIFSCSLPGSLEQLACWDNPLGRIDVSGMPNLVDLACANTGLTELDVTHNPKLLRLAFNDNAIRHIDLSGNPLLEELSCWNCALGSLSLSNNPRLNMVICWGNLITSLDVSRNLSLGSRPEEKDYGLHCSPMEDEKGNNLLETLFVAENQFIPGVTPDRDDAMVPGGTDIQTLRQGMIPIKDKGFKAYLVANFDIDRDGEISYSEAERITWIQMNSEEWGVESLQGIEYMPNLSYLYCAGKWYDDGLTFGPLGTLRWVDVSNNPKLVSLTLAHNAHLGETIHSIDLSGNPELEGISLSFSNMEYPDISHLTKLKYFEARGCYGKVPDFSGFTKLEYLE